MWSLYNPVLHFISNISLVLSSAFQYSLYQTLSLYILLTMAEISDEQKELFMDIVRNVKRPDLNIRRWQDAMTHNRLLEPFPERSPFEDQKLFPPSDAKVPKDPYDYSNGLGGPSIRPKGWTFAEIRKEHDKYLASKENKK